jgi:hypothetical protein
MHPTESRDTSVRSVSDIAGKTQSVVDIQKNAKKKYCMPIKSAVV